MLAGVAHMCLSAPIIILRMQKIEFPEENLFDEDFLPNNNKNSITIVSSKDL